MNRPIRFFSFRLSLTFAALLLITASGAAAQSTAPDIKYATAFTIQSFDTYRLLTVTRPWRGTDRTFEYLFVKRGTPDPEGYGAVFPREALKGIWKGLFFALEKK